MCAKLSPKDGLTNRGLRSRVGWGALSETRGTGACLQILQHPIVIGVHLSQRCLSWRCFPSVSLALCSALCLDPSHAHAAILEATDPVVRIYSGSEVRYTSPLALSLVILLLGCTDFVPHQFSFGVTLAVAGLCGYLAWTIPTSLQTLVFVGLAVPSVTKSI